MKYTTMKAGLVVETATIELSIPRNNREAYLDRTTNQALTQIQPADYGYRRLVSNLFSVMRGVGKESEPYRAASTARL